MAERRRRVSRVKPSQSKAARTSLEGMLLGITSLKTSSSISSGMFRCCTNDIMTSFTDVENEDDEPTCGVGVVTVRGKNGY